MIRRYAVKLRDFREDVREITRRVDVRQCVTRFVKRDLVGHDIHTVEEAGLKGLENGDLLPAASDTHGVLITVDQNLPYQQTVASLNIAIVVLAAKRNSYARLKLISAITAQLSSTDSPLYLRGRLSQQGYLPV